MFSQAIYHWDKLAITLLDILERLATLTLARLFPHISIIPSNCPSQSALISQNSFHWDCSAQTHKLYHRNSRQVKCSRHYKITSSQQNPSRDFSMPLVYLTMLSVGVTYIRQIAHHHYHMGLTSVTLNITHS